MRRYVLFKWDSCTEWSWNRSDEQLRNPTWWLTLLTARCVTLRQESRRQDLRCKRCASPSYSLPYVLLPAWLCRWLRQDPQRLIILQVSKWFRWQTGLRLNLFVPSGSFPPNYTRAYNECVALRHLRCQNNWRIGPLLDHLLPRLLSGKSLWPGAKHWETDP